MMNEPTTPEINQSQGIFSGDVATPDTPPIPATTEPVGQPAQPVEQPTVDSGKIVLGKEELQTMLKETVGALTPQVGPQQPQRQMSPEEFEKTFNVYRPNTDTLARILNGGEDGVNAFYEALNGIHKQTMTMANYVVEAGLRTLQDRLSPLEERLQSQQMEAYRSEFFKTNPDLAQYEPLCEAVLAKMRQEGVKFKTPQDAMKEVATQTRNMLKNAVGTPQGTPTAPNSTQTNTSSTMPVLNGSGRGGGGTPTGSSRTKSDAEAVFA